MKKYLHPTIFFGIVLIFFWQFIFKGLLPIPADTIIGLYHPYRDLYNKEYPSGIPYKNFLITDPVRQQYPWRELGISTFKKGTFPVWNPYSGIGMPLLGNVQSAILYPLNVIFIFFSFPIGWSILVMLQPILAGLFMYFYLTKINLRLEASLLGSIAFAFSGFFIAWLEWNTILHVVVWLPLILLSIEKILNWFSAEPISNIKPARRLASIRRSGQGGYQISKLQIKDKKQILFWGFVFLFSLTSSFFAGHLQIFFYIFLIQLIYLITKLLIFKKKEKGKAVLLFVICYLLFVTLTSIQWLPALRFINLSAREADQANLPDGKAGWQKDGWFIPYQHLVQFLAPDFFGNPSTLNYWGVWNYGEMVGYVGILPLMMALFALIWRKDKKTLFFGFIFFISLIFATPTWFAKLPYKLQIPLIATSQPTRLLFLIDFSLAVLAALGFDYFLKRKERVVQTVKLLSIMGVVYVTLFIFVVFASRLFYGEKWIANLAISKRNLIVPSFLFIASGSLLLFFDFLRNSVRFQQPRQTWQQLTRLAIYGLFLLTFFDLVRFGWKFTPFVDSKYLFPETSSISFLKKQAKPFRIMATDKRILPPNFSLIYRIETVDVYDPLFLRSYGELVSTWQRGSASGDLINFNRMITPQDYENQLTDLLNVKYILSLSPINSPKLKLVFEEGQTKIYENQSAFPRAFFAESVIAVANSEEAMNKLFEKDIDLRKQAIVEGEVNISPNPLHAAETVTIVKYSENTVVIETNGLADRFLVLADSYYPTWKAYIYGKQTVIYRTDFMLRGIIVPKGQHMIVFSVGL